MKGHFFRLAGAALLTVPQSLLAQHFTQPAVITTLQAPVILDTAGRFQARFARVGDDMFIAGQPTEEGLRYIKSLGVTTVINLRSPPEMARIPFDEPALVAKLGMKYVYIPMRGTPELPYSPAAVKTFAEAVRNTTNGKVLLHCTVAWRASHLWAAYLMTERGIAQETALSNARAINLMDEHHMPGTDGLPVEDFLGRPLKTGKP